jgi:hypothetical protein
VSYVFDAPPSKSVVVAKHKTPQGPPEKSVRALILVAGEPPGSHSVQHEAASRSARLRRGRSIGSGRSYAA